MGGFHPMPYPCKQGMKPTLSLLKSHSAFALHSCPLLLSPRHTPKVFGLDRTVNGPEYAMPSPVNLVLYEEIWDAGVMDHFARRKELVLESG